MTDTQVAPQLISALGSERATVDAGAKVVTFQGKTHVAYQEVAREGYPNCVRTLDHTTGQWSAPFLLNHGVDNHARAVLTVDAKGFLHVVLGGHNTPVTYRRSVRANDSSAWTEAEPAGDGTYPLLVAAPDGTLYLVFRVAGLHGVDLYARRPGEPWKHQHRMVRRADEYKTGYAAYHSSLRAGHDGTLHLQCDFYEGTGFHEHRGIHQAICAMRSADGGQTWTRHDGTPVTLPARPEDMDILARSTRERHESLSPPDLRGGGIALLPDGAPAFLYLSHEDAPGEIILATPAPGGGWTQRKLDALTHYDPDRRPVEARLTQTADGGLRILCTLAIYPAYWNNGKPTRNMTLNSPESQRLVWGVLDSPAGEVRVVPQIEPGQSINAPNPEWPCGANTTPANHLPALVWFDGSRDYPYGHDSYFKNIKNYLESGKHLVNNVWFTPPRALR